MKKVTLLLGIIVLFTACSSSKRAEKAIAYGDYDDAIAVSVKKLRKKTTSKRKQKQILLLEEAFAKAVIEDARNLERFKLDTNPEVIASIYETYVNLEKRQELIRPILPLHISKKNRNATFIFEDYTSEIANAKTTLVEYLYLNASKLLAVNTKQSARNAYDDLSYLNRINSNYKDVNTLLEDAHFKGTNFVEVELLNETNQMIPRRLEDDLLNFNSYGLDQFWTVFHSNIDSKIDYSYKLQLLFKQIDVSPEQFHEKEFVLEKEVKDGFEYVLDRNGNVAVDSLGNSIKIDKYITVKANYFEIHQEKACHIAAEVILNNLKTNQEVEVIPLESEFIFINDFAELDGDIRTLDNVQKELIKAREIPFPTAEQLVFDTGEDLKNKLKEIIEDLEI